MSRLVLAGILVVAVSATIYNVWPRPDSEGVWVVTVATEPAVPEGWTEAGSGEVDVHSAHRTFARWEPIGANSFQSLHVYVDDYGTVRTAQARERSPEKSTSAPNFEIQGHGDSSLLPIESNDWDDYAVCGNGTPSDCTWWYYFGRFGRFRVTVILQDDVGAPLTSDEFATRAATLFDAVGGTSETAEAP